MSDWLNSYKMPQYVSLLVDSGYDNTDFLLGITAEVRRPTDYDLLYLEYEWPHLSPPLLLQELAELGVSKVGHRKRILSALSRLIPKEHFLTFKPVSGYSCFF